MSAKVTVAGQITDPMFHKGVAIVKGLQEAHPEAIDVEILQFHETQWILFLKKLSNDLKGVFYNHNEANPIVYLNGKDYIGDANDFAKWALFNFNFTEKDGLNVYNKVAKEEHHKAINKSQKCSYASMTFQYEGPEKKVNELSLIHI